MATRRSFIRNSANILALGALAVAKVRAADLPGVTDTEIKVGQTFPYSGPASSYGLSGRIQLAYLKMINERGGVNGRKITLISLDDAYSPPKTVEQTRRLVEQEQVAFIWGSLGTPTNMAIREYLNNAKIPQLFIATGTSTFNDPERFPWTLPGLFQYRTESRIFTKHILASDANAKISILYQNDDFGRDYLNGIYDVLGAQNEKALVKALSYEVSDPTVDSQIITLKGSGANNLVLAATPKAAAQAIRKSFDLDWRPERYVTYASSAITSVMKTAGVEKSKGVISSAIVKNPDDPAWKDDPAILEYFTFMAKYMPGEPTVDYSASLAYEAGWTLVELISRCGNDLSREHILWQATHLENVRGPMLLPGGVIETTPTDYRPLRSAQLERFDGERWQLFGDPISG